MATTGTGGVWSVTPTYDDVMIPARGSIPIITSCCVGLLGLVANGFVLLVLLGYGRLRYRPSAMLVIHQTVTDAICSAFLLLVNIIYFTLEGKLKDTWGDFVCRVLINELLFWIAFTASSLSLVSITLERYLVVVHPVFHRNHFTKRVVVLSVVLNWVFAVIFLVPLGLIVKVEHGMCVVSIKGLGSLYVYFVISGFLGVYLLPCLFLVFGYGRMIWVLLKKNKVVTVVITNKNRMSRSQMNTTTTMVVIAVVFFICLTPFQLYIVTAAFGDMEWSRSQINIYGCLLILSLLNCCINPFIYAVKYNTFKTGFRRMFKLNTNTAGDTTIITELSQE